LEPLADRFQVDRSQVAVSQAPQFGDEMAADETTAPGDDDQIVFSD
jgi:hypothetical protein